MLSDLDVLAFITIHGGGLLPPFLATLFGMAATDYKALEAQMALLQRRLRRAELWNHVYRLGCVVLVAILGLASWPRGSVSAQTEPQIVRKLRVRELDVLDEKGRERIVIAAPLANPIVDGKIEHRVREVSAAVQFKAPNGNEQGGIAMSDDGAMIFGIDDERGQERAHLYYLPNRGSGVFLTGKNNKQTLSLQLPNGDEDPSLKMTDKTGKLVPIATPQKK